MGKEVVVVTATDLDKGSNGIVSYAPSMETLRGNLKSIHAPAASPLSNVSTEK